MRTSVAPRRLALMYSISAFRYSPLLKKASARLRWRARFASAEQPARPTQRITAASAKALRLITFGISFGIICEWYGHPTGGKTTIGRTMGRVKARRRPARPGGAADC